MTNPIGNFEGHPCKKCGEIIRVYSRSGLCRKCWHAMRGGYPEGNERDRIERIMEYHREDLKKYHFVSIDGQQIPEHRYVLEKATGKPIPKNWVVHHLNGLKGDNRVENLVAMSRSDHDSKALINALKARIRELEQLHFSL